MIIKTTIMRRRIKYAAHSQLRSEVGIGPIFARAVISSCSSLSPLNDASIAAKLLNGLNKNKKKVNTGVKIKLQHAFLRSR